MSKELLLEQILGDGSSRGLGKLSGNEVLIGRDPGEGLKVENQAISRQHGTFLKIRNHWFFKDIGSTNGSWRNGRHIKQGQIVLVRPGDLLQLADTPIRILAAPSDQPSAAFRGFPAFSSSTLIVFADNEFHDEFPLPEYGRALVVGGNQADLRISEDVNELPRLVVERRGERVCAYGVAEGLAITLNGKEVTETVTLSDGDELCVAQYRILFNDPKSDRPEPTPIAAQPQSFQQHADLQMGGSQPAAGAGDFTGGGAAVLREWESGPSTAAISGFRESGAHLTPTSGGRFTFGRSDLTEEEDVEGTMAIDPAEVEARLAGYDMHPSSRYVGPEQHEGAALDSIEDKLIVLIGFVLLLVLIGLVVWWVFL